MELITYFDFLTTANSLETLPNEILMLVYDYLDPNLNNLLCFICDLEKKLSNEDIFNYFYKYDGRFILQFKTIYPTYNETKTYKIPKNYNVINSTLDCIRLIPIFYKPISKFTKQYDGITKHEKHHIECILNHGYTNMYNLRFFDKKKPMCGYTFRESVILALLFLKTDFIFNGIDIQFFSRRNNRLTKKILIDNGFVSKNDFYLKKFKKDTKSPA